MDNKFFGAKYLVPLFLFLIASVYVFTTYSSWLTDGCIAPLGADVKYHILTVRAFVEQVAQYKMIYPVDYLLDFSGAYWYVRSIIPLLVPSFFSLFLPFNTAFFFVYLSLYVLVVLALYFLVKTVTDEFTAFLCSIFFLFSNLSNMVFSVGGNYPFFFGFLFFFLAMAFIFRYSVHPTAKNLILLSLSTLALGLTYTFSLIFLVSFMCCYGLVAHRRELLKIACFLTAALGMVLLPSLFTGGTLSSASPEETYSRSPIDLLTTYILPSKPFGWIYSSSTQYSGSLDVVQGIHIYVGGILAILYILFILRDKTIKIKFLFTYLFVMLGWVLLSSVVAKILPFDFLVQFFGYSLPTERLMMHLAFSFLLLFAYVLHTLSLRWKDFVGVFLISLSVLGLSFFSHNIFFLFVGVAVVFGLKEYVPSLPPPQSLPLYVSYVVSFVLLYLLLFPITGNVETTNLAPRTSVFIVDDIKNHLSSNDVFSFVGGWSLQATISSCTAASSPFQWDRDSLTSGLSASSINVFDASNQTKDFIEWRGVTKILVVLDQILEGNVVNTSRVDHLVRWYGSPRISQTSFLNDGVESPYYPILVFDVPPKNKSYVDEMISPIRIHIVNSAGAANILTNREYHPWWYAVDGESGQRLSVENDGGFIRITDIQGSKDILLKFSMRYFLFGFLVSVVGIFLLVRKIIMLLQSSKLNKQASFPPLEKSI